MNRIFVIGDTQYEDDDEYTRYLTSYLVENAEIFIGTSFDGYSPRIKEKELYKIIKNFTSNLP